MRAKILVVLQSVFLGLGLLVLTPSVNPTTVGKREQPLPTAKPPFKVTVPFVLPNSQEQSKAFGGLAVHHRLVR